MLIPATVVGRGQHHTIAYNPEHGPSKPSELAGKTCRRARLYADHRRLGARHPRRGLRRPPRQPPNGSRSRRPSWPNTTDPPIVSARRRASRSCRCCSMASSTRRSSATSCPIRGSSRSFPIADEVANRKWSESHGGVPINHMLVIRDELDRSRSGRTWSREIYRLCKESQARGCFAGTGGLPTLDPWRFGVEANRRSLEIVIDFAVKQRPDPARGRGRRAVQRHDAGAGVKKISRIAFAKPRIGGSPGLFNPALTRPCQRSRYRC